MSKQPRSSYATPHLPLLWYIPVRSDSVIVKTRKELEYQLLARVSKDESLRRDLIANPRDVLSREFQIDIPEEIRVNVLEETETGIQMVVPHNPYANQPEDNLRREGALGLEEIALWVTRDGRNTLLDEERSVTLLVELWRDAASRSAFLDDPKKFLEQRFSLSIPEEYTFSAVEESPVDWYIVLPSPGNGDEGDALDPTFWEEANLGPRYVQVMTFISVGSGGCLQSTRICIGISCLPTIVEV